MKRGQKGITVGKLLCTVLCILLLVFWIFSGSEDIDKAEEDFATFVADMDSVKKAFLTEGVINLMGEEATKNNDISKAQAYNYLAKGGTTKLVSKKQKEKAWLTKAQAEALPCTRIEKEATKEAIGIYLPKRKVKTYKSDEVDVSYFITNKGDIFIWPPYYRSKDGLFYVNDTTVVKGTKTSPGDWTIYLEEEAEMYKDGFTFLINGVEIKIVSTGKDVLEITPDTSVEEIKTMASIAYKDKKNAKAPRGTEFNG